MCGAIVCICSGPRSLSQLLRVTEKKDNTGCLSSSSLIGKRERFFALFFRVSEYYCVGGEGGGGGGSLKWPCKVFQGLGGEGWLVGSGVLVQGRENPVDFLLEEFSVE